MSIENNNSQHSVVTRIQCGNGNCFLVTCGENSILVDVSKEGYKDKIIEACKGHNIRLIVLTHGHFDHAQNAAFLSNHFNAPIAMHELDVPLIEDNLLQPLYAHTITGKVVLYASIKSMKNEKIEKFTPSLLLKEGDNLSEYGIPATVVELPGHTNGSIGIMVDGNGKEFIVGDALMHMIGSAGRSLLYTNREQMDESCHKISKSGANIIHFGHGSSTENKDW